MGVVFPARGCFFNHRTPWGAEMGRRHIARLENVSALYVLGA